MKIKPKNRHSGFALVVTLTLMILLTILAVGLLSLSTISLRSTGHGDDAAKARANAKLALMMAIGELQKQVGPDQRITAPANLVNTSAAPGITGVWNSWRPPSSNPNYVAAKTGNNFLGYLMSNPYPEKQPNPSEVPGQDKDDSQLLVGKGTLGTSSSGSEISAPLVKFNAQSKVSPGALSWVALDEGVKSRVDLEPSLPASGIGESVTRVGAPERNGFAKIAGEQPELSFLDESDEKLRVSLPKMISFGEMDVEGGKAAAAGPYFNDLTVSSASLQTDVVNGGLKTDLSVLFDSLNLPSNYLTRRLYSGNTNGFQNSTGDPLWAVYQKYSRMYQQTSPTDNPVNGIKATVQPGYQLLQTTSGGKTTFEPNMKTLKGPALMPTVVRVDTVFSLVSRPAHDSQKPGPNDPPWILHLMYLPVITLHNPYSSPLRFTNIALEFSNLPMAFEIIVNGVSKNGGLKSWNEFYAGGPKPKIFKIALSNSNTTATEVIMPPGETMIFGKPFSPTLSWNDEVAGSKDGVVMFDHSAQMAGNAKSIPGMITNSKFGIGYDIDWLGNGIVRVAPNDSIQVRYGPKAPPNSVFTSSINASYPNTFSMTTYLGAVKVGTTQFLYKDDATLKKVTEEGISPRFTTQRTFPETYPKATVDVPITAQTIHEADATPFSGYINAKPFALFSISAKTTVESFTRSRPVADTGIAMQMSTSDFSTAATQGSSPMEMALVPIRGGKEAIEYDVSTNKAYFFGGHGPTHGSTTATIYEIPVAPLQSIAQLRHANGASVGSAPFVTYSVGESRAHPALPANSSYFPSGNKVLLDHSWLANDALWDRYFFSTLATLQGPAYTGGSGASLKVAAEGFFDGSKPLPNARNMPNLPPGKPVTDVATDALTASGMKSAAYLLTKGGFNVNSTSVAAWTSVLSGLVGAEVPLAAGGNEEVGDNMPFLRMRRPQMGASATNKEKLWGGYSTLDPGQIDNLAQAIVAEVRARGPFLSMSEFVNRRLAAPGVLSRGGAIQAAIDSLDLDTLTSVNSEPIDASIVANFGWKNSDAVTGNTAAGAAGDLTQGDILSAIGSFVTVRSDTFKIRAYGDARDSKGAVTARAWCEATVQRVPEYIDQADLSDGVAAAPANVVFGRAIKVISFRWLTPGEI